MIFPMILLSLLGDVESACAPYRACFASSMDVSKLPDHKMTTNSTCGTPPEYFCVHMDCSLKCDTKNNQTWHPPQNILDDFESLTYWKSKNFDEPVFIQFDFNYKLLLHQVTITFQFEAPNGMYIQRSQDFGKTYKTLAYFATQCNDIFNMAESINYKRMDVLCFSVNPGNLQRQISYAPRRDDYVASEVLKGGAVRDFYLASNVRIILHEFFKPSDFNIRVADKRKYYFAIRDVDVQAACYCNGMSNLCSPRDYGTCLCQKNTEGRNCERCMELFNNREWKFGRACEACVCNNHAAECVYEETRGYGVCIDCKHNTKGDKCETCDIGFYSNGTEKITSPNSCVSCNCLEAGVLYGSITCDPYNGECYCKRNVEGVLCNGCKDEYYGLSVLVSTGCLPCGCSQPGSVSLMCNKVTGVCQCKLGFTGRTCSQCVRGYFGYPVYNPNECRECNCKPSGALSMTCDKTGQCVCRKNYYGVKCEQIQTGYYSASINQLVFSSNTAVIRSPKPSFRHSLNITDSSGNTFFVVGNVVGLGGSLTSQITQLEFKVRVPITTFYDLHLQYVTAFNFDDVIMDVELRSAFRTYTCNNGTVKVPSFTSRSLTASIRPTSDFKLFGSLCLMEGLYDISVLFSPTSSGGLSNSANIFIMSLLLIPNYKQSPRFISATDRTQSSVIQYFLLAPSPKKWPKNELRGASYLSYVYGSYYDNAFHCVCDKTGSINPMVCNIYGGQCNCKKNIYGRACDHCLPQYYNFSSGLGCDACNCDDLGSFRRNCNHNIGQCDCRPNVIGRTCNKCRFQYYGIESGKGCEACNCVSLYSLSSQCSNEGICRCKPGVGGDKCDRCSPGFYRLSVNGCVKCTCNQIGTQGNQCDPFSGGCTCKDRTTGKRCNQCQYGYYGFSKDYPETCLPCHCSGQTQECDPANDYYLMNVSTTFSTDVNNNAIQGWSPVDINGYAIGETSWDWAPVYAINRGYAKLVDNGGTHPEHLFFSAPKVFLGKKRSSYMYFLRFDLTQESTSQPLGNSNIGDIIMQGVGLKFKLVRSISRPPFHQNFKTYRIQFHEKHWRKNHLSGEHPTSVEMRATLGNLKSLWIRGKWTREKRKFSGVANVFMDYSSYNVAGKAGLRAVRNVEYCTCPTQYKGQFCQHCNNGFTKTLNLLDLLPVCSVCKCNDHSTTCHPTKGTCYNCQHKTEGPTCNKCVDGYYGEPTRGTEDDCKPCACPGGSFANNQFANKCLFNGNDNETPYRCLNCQQGYSGIRCHVCSDGYYGNPLDPLGKCSKCTCNGNVNPQASSNCNTTTGECLRCLFNTVGHSCQYCRPGYYGNALTQTCRACSCSKMGSSDNDCQNVTGQCNCKSNVIGRTCDACAEDTFNFLSNKGCELCKCNEEGSKSLQCDATSGKCECIKAVTGIKCDTCAAGFYNLSKGCLPCSCSKRYSMKNATCHPVSGQCLCIKSRLGGVYSGRTCSECDVNAIGTPPNCELCHSPCYANWQTYIDNEAAEISSTQRNVTEVLSIFGGMSYDKVKENLNWLKANLTYINQIFTSNRYNASTTEQKFQQIDNYVLEFETSLKQTQKQISRSLDFFENTIGNFNGTIPLSFLMTSPLPVYEVKPRTHHHTQNSQYYVNASMITQIARDYQQITSNNNISAKAMFQTITKQFDKINIYNASVFDAAQALSKSILQLSEAETERMRVSSFFDTRYKTKFAASAYELKKIHDVVVRVVLLQNSTVAVYKNAMSILSAINHATSLAERQANRQGSEALAVVQTLSRMKVNSLTLNQAVSLQMGISADLRRKVQDELSNVQKEALALAQGLTDLSSAKYKTSDAMVVARQINKAKIPVSVPEIQHLSNQIISTIINEGIINATYTDAQHGLIRAKQVKERSQLALHVSQSTLANIQNLEASVDKSAMLRAKSVIAFRDTDRKLRSLRNITSVIGNHFNAVSGEGGSTLSLLKKSISDINNNDMCFVNTKFLIDNATLVSGFAGTKAKEALTMHNHNERILPGISKKINTIHDHVLGIKSETEAAAQTSAKLLKDASEAEMLLKKFEEQQAELDELESENERLEAELSQIMNMYEQHQIKLHGCNKP